MIHLGQIFRTKPSLFRFQNKAFSVSTHKWRKEAFANCAEVEDSGDDFVIDEDVKTSIPVRAYFFSTSVDLRSLLEQNRPNFIQPTSRMTNYIVLRFGSNKPDYIGLGASISGSDSSYMVVFQYGSIVLFNVRDNEIDGYMKIVEKHASGLLPEMRKNEQKPKHGVEEKRGLIPKDETDPRPVCRSNED